MLFSIPVAIFLFVVLGICLFMGWKGVLSQEKSTFKTTTMRILSVITLVALTEFGFFIFALVK